MAVSVDTVYKTVLLILNKEQRGYITPDEFNKTANQVQLEIYLKYFDDLNQFIRSVQVDLDYASKVLLLDEKMAIFKSQTGLSFTSSGFKLPVGLQELGTVVYNNIEIERVQRSSYYNILKSELTAPSTNYPIYLYEDGYIKVQPAEITTNVVANYLRIPLVVSWNYTVDPSRGNYIFNSGTSVNFELHSSEQTEIILRILEYSGVIIRDAQVVQAAASKIQQSHISEKQ